jgi:hypothetical protein
MFLDTSSRVLHLKKFLFVLGGFMHTAQQSPVYLDTPSKALHLFKYLFVLLRGSTNFVHIMWQSFMFFDIPL